MITEEKCYCGTCDNCQELYEDFSGFSLFVDKDHINERMQESGWYTGHLYGEHENKCYCSDCFKYDEEIDDKIIIDLNRKKE